MQRLFLSSSVARCDHYKTLGLERSATQAQIDQAYLDSVRDFKIASLHQEKSNSIRLEKLLEAFETLSDEDLKKAYDERINHVLNSKEYADEILKNLEMEESISKTEHPQAPVARKGQAITHDMAYWFASTCLAVFLIITVPKLLYIIYAYIVYGSL